MHISFVGVPFVDIHQQCCFLDCRTYAYGLARLFCDLPNFRLPPHRSVSGVWQFWAMYFQHSLQCISLLFVCSRAGTFFPSYHLLSSHLHCALDCKVFINEIRQLLYIPHYILCVQLRKVKRCKKYLASCGAKLGPISLIKTPSPHPLDYPA